MKEIAATRMRYGYRRPVSLRREGWRRDHNEERPRSADRQ
jgi:hypothetical protein